MPENAIPNYENLLECKGYGPHEYQIGNGKVCKHGCGCWISFDGRGGGPVGLDPLHGECPGNPLDGKKLGGNLDWATVVVRRIYHFLAMQKAISVAGFHLRQLLQFTEDKKEEETKE